MRRLSSAQLTGLFLCLLCGCLRAQPNPITNGSFEELTPGGMPVDWEFVGEKIEVSPEAHTGKRSLRFVRAKETKVAETGLNRSWRPNSGEQGAMLSQLKGGFRFWYKAASCRKAKLTIYAIPMSNLPMEDTGAPRATFEVPTDHIGDGIWHEGVLRYDFTGEPKTKWVHVSSRIVGEAGELLLDDFTYVEKVGPLLSLPRMTVLESDARPGKEATVTVTVENAGDADIGSTALSLQAPAGLAVTPGKVTAARLAPGERRKVSWTVTGERRPGTNFRVRAVAGNLSTATSTSLSPDLSLVWFLADRFILAPGETSTVNLRIENRGLASASGVKTRIVSDGGIRVMGDTQKLLTSIAPGSTAQVQWLVRTDTQPGEQTVAVEVEAGGEKPLRSEAKLLVTSAVKAPAHRLTGPLWFRSDSTATVGELRLGEGASEVVALLPHFGRVVFRNPKGEVEEVRARIDPATRRTGGLNDTQVTAKAKDAEGGEWSFRLRATVVDPTRTRLRVEAICDQPREVLAFEGPTLCVLEKPASHRDEAVLPGLEWLADEEVSSSTLDIAEDHADRIRYVPHPNKITIPFASVHNQRGTFGLLWDVHQKWDGTNDRPQPVFASPDRFEGHRCHLIGLMAPNVLNGLPENKRLAETPLELSADKPLSLEATIYSDPEGKDALTAMDAWFRTYRPDPVLPPPEGDYRKQTEFSMRAYAESLYLREEKAWMPFLGGPALWRKPHHSPAYAYDLLMAGRITKDAALARKYRALAEEQLGSGRPKGAAARPVADDLGFDAAGAEGHVVASGITARSLADTMGSDGAWRFDADLEDQGVFKGMDYHELGKDNASELGTSANRAYQVLRYARISGDQDLYRAGVKALEFMKRFRVPRAAQVWEVPVHTPDILAAADAVDAYLEAYRFSGDVQWLTEAKRWARAGLPFVYVWNDARYPWMRYGSIPVFGATWYRGSWFGVLVQWNGLRHAYALLKLSEYDSSTDRGYTWKDFAVGLTHSAMYQQSDESKNVALWPDSYNTMNAARANWDFPPSQILQNVYALVGRQSEPETIILTRGEAKRQHEVAKPIGDPSKIPSRLHFTSGAEILAASWYGDRFTASLRYASQEQGYSLLVGLKKPMKVTLDGKYLPEVNNLETSEASGWRYDGRYNCLSIKVDHDGEAAVAVEGIVGEWKPLAPRPVSAIDFAFDNDSEGWVEASDLSFFESKEGVLLSHTTGGDPYMVRFACRVAGESVKTIVVRLRVTAGTVGQFYWTTEASPAFAEDKVTLFSLIADGQFHEYRIPVGNHALWRGQTITGVRLDPGNGAEGAEVGVDFVRGE